MNITLANKYRPQTLDEVFGQDAAVAALKGTIKRGHMPSAILISGVYGSGKTSLAGIYARILNCVTHDLCGKCMSCKFGKAHPDITFHDCGTDGKIDDIRSIISASKVAPTTQKRVIILDEIQQLRDASEKAILVASENPSPKTVFIACTTNPEKIGKALMSRCLHIALKPVAEDAIVTRLKQIVKAEKMKPSKSLGQAIKMIASMSNGSMREAVSKLELVMLSGNNSIEAITGGSDGDIDQAAVDLVAAIAKWDVTEAVKVIRTINNARGLINKSRWLVDYLVGAKTKTAKFTPHTGRLYASVESKGKFKTPLMLLVMIQKLLAETEIQFNTTTLEETLVLYANVGNFIAEHRP